MDDKLVVSNRAALLRKYGEKGLAKIRKSLLALIAADKKRGLQTAVIYIDDALTMKAMKGKAVVNAADPRENKAAIDAAYAFTKPAHLLILGAPDVIPHQDVKDPLPRSRDDDPIVWSDLPYACDAPYSRGAVKFVRPSRAVGRLPDLFGATEPSRSHWRGR